MQLENLQNRLLIEEWNGWLGNFHRYRRKKIKELLIEIGVNKNTTVLELGCGTSLLGEMFEKDEIPKILASDISKERIELGKKKYPYINFLVDDALNTKIKGKFDVIFASEIIEHLKDPYLAVKNWKKLMKPGSYLIITTPNRTWSFSKTEQAHISLMNIKQVKDILKKLDFKIIKIKGIDIFIPFLNRMRFLKKIPSLSNLIYQTTMRLPYNTPFLARNIIYIARL